jgi:crotonobetainyl-CoA:carnitine CoA-transferase CaiB-like acyl-CoA transferase
MNGSQSRGTTGPMSGIRVIDLTTTFMGPYATALMARMGADVVKVEAPGGDIVRGLGGGKHPGMGPIFLNANHGKRSIALNLKHPEGMAILHRLLADADVFVTNMRPEAFNRLGLSHTDLREKYPRLVHAVLPGFGSGGPYRDQAAYDDVIQAVSGMASTQGQSADPSYVRTPVADKSVALMGLAAILAALLARERTGQGQSVEVPMFETMAQFMMLDQQGGYVYDPPAGPAGYARTASPHRRPYRTADGFLSVVVYTDRQWLSFFELIGQPELVRDPRFRSITERTRHIDELYQLIADVLPTRSSAQWLEVLRDSGIPCVPVLRTEDLLQDEHLRAVEFFESVDHPTEGPLLLARLPILFSAGAPGPQRPAPRLGEHGPELLRAMGSHPDEVEHLIKIGVLHVPPHAGVSPDSTESPK